MRKKKLDVVFDENVNVRAGDILDLILDDMRKKGHKGTPTKSMILRAAMNIGLHELDDYFKSISLNDVANSHALLRVADIRAALGSKK